MPSLDGAPVNGAPTGVRRDRLQQGRNWTYPMTIEDRSDSPVRGQLARTWGACRRMLLLLALVSTGIARAAMTVSREFFTNTAGALATPPGPNPRLRGALAWLI